MNINNKRFREGPKIPEATVNKKPKTSPKLSSIVDSTVNYLWRLASYAPDFKGALREAESFYVRKENGRPCSFQVFLNDKDQIKIVIHPKPKKKIGEGTFRIVRESILLDPESGAIEDCATVTPRFLSKDRVEEQESKMCDEQYILNRLKGTRGIVEMIDCCSYSYKSTDPENQDDYPKTNIILEKGLYDLQVGIAKRAEITPSKILDLAHAVNKIHELGYAHQDIKLENIIDDGTKLCLIDFASCSAWNEPLIFGTYTYISPGMFEYFKRYIKLISGQCADFELDELKPIVNQPNDIFSLGLIYYSCYTFSMIPWYNDITPCFNSKDLEESILACEKNQKVIKRGYEELLEEYPRPKRTKFIQLILDMLNPDDEKRIKSPEVLSRLQNIFGPEKHLQNPGI